MSQTTTHIATTYYVGRRSDQYFGFDARFVRESTRFDKPTRIPETRPELVGVVNLRNAVLPILLPDQWLRTEAQAFDPAKPIAVIENTGTQIALQLDAVIGVFTVDASALLPHPYHYETPVFRHLVIMENDLLVTTVDLKALFKEIQSVIL